MAQASDPQEGSYGHLRHPKVIKPFAQGLQLCQQRCRSPAPAASSQGYLVY